MATRSGSTKPSNGGTKPRTTYGTGSNIPSKGGASSKGGKSGGKC